jgi:hypothetical protein
MALLSYKGLGGLLLVLVLFSYLVPGSRNGLMANKEGITERSVKDSLRKVKVPSFKYIPQQDRLNITKCLF